MASGSIGGSGQPSSLPPPGQKFAASALQAGAVLAVATAAVSLVAGLGTYLYIRFTQHREKPPASRKPDES